MLIIRAMERIAIVRLSALGDVINTLPVLKPLREALPSAEIYWIAEDGPAELLSHQELDGVVTVPRRRWQKLLRKVVDLPRVLSEFGSLRSELRSKGFTLALDFHGNLRSGVIAYLTGAPVRVGYSAPFSREWNWLFTTTRVELPNEALHRVERHLALLRGLSIEPAYSRPSLRLPEEAVLRARQWAEGLRRPIIAIHPGTSPFGSYKQWSVEKYSRLVSELSGQGYTVVLTWGTGELDEAKRIASAGGVLAPKTPTPTALAGLLAEVDLAVGADTGPLHLASILGVPVVALFGPKDPRIYAPYFSRRRVIELDLPCRPCKKRRCDNPRCILGIGVSTVRKAIEDLLAGSEPAVTAE